MVWKNTKELREYLISLEGKNITSSGNWTPSQILGHLSDSIEFVLSQKKGAFEIPEWIQNTFGKLILWKFFAQGYMDKGLPNPIQKVVPDSKDIENERVRLLSLMDQFENHRGTFNSHPVFGKLNKEEWNKLHLLHCENHLKYLQAKD